MKVLFDIEVEVTQHRQTNFESWLLSHGRLPMLSNIPARRNSRRYVVKRVSERDLSMVDKTGGKVLTHPISRE